MFNHDKWVMDRVLDNPKTCRKMWDALEERGVQFNVSADKLTHAEIKAAVQMVLDELERRETTRH